jgi:hypothetical protein
MFNTWITNAFQYFITQLMPIPIDQWGPKYLQDMLAVWTPDLSPFSGGAWGWLMVGMIGLGVAIGLWFVIPVVIGAAATGDARAIGQAVLGLAAAAAAGPTALAFAAAVRVPVIATAESIMASAATATMKTDTPFGMLSAFIAIVTYLLAGLIASYAFVFTVLLAPLAAASLVMRSGVQTFVKWLSWYGTLLLAPIFAAIGMAIAGFMGTAVQVPGAAQLALCVGTIFAAVSPFIVLAMMSRITVGGGAEGSTKVGAGSSAQSVVQVAAMRAVR